jgi:hypothetical protein
MREKITSPAFVFVALAISAQGGHVDDEAVFHVSFNDALEGFVDLLDGNDFDVGGNSLLRAVVEHLLRLSHAPDDRPGPAAAFEEEMAGEDDGRLVGETDLGVGGVALERFEVRVDVVRSGDGIEDEVGSLEITTSSAPRRLASAILDSEVVNWTTCAPKA